jgi:cell wall-associated NlpC family hydrolase
VVLTGTLLLTLGLATPALAAPSFPSWGDVQKAAQNVSTKKAEIAKLNRIVASLQQAAADDGKVAAIRDEEYLSARNALDAATAKADKLQSQADAARKRAAKSKSEAGQLAAQLARSNGSGLTMKLLLDSHNASNLLSVLGIMSKISESAANIFARAAQQENSAKSLTAQARVAKSVRQTKSTDAASALAKAKQAAAAAQAKVTAQNKPLALAAAQLASLKGTSAGAEAGYLAGLVWQAKQEAVKTPPPDGPPIVVTPPPGQSTPPPPPTAPNTSAVDGAIAYARAQLGKPYALGGAGPSAFDCSGLTLKAYAAVGVYIGIHGSTSQYNYLKSENRLVPLSDRQPGDLLWYSDGGSTKATKYHVTLYIGNGEMIEAPYAGVPVRIAAVRFGDLVPYAGRPTG